MAVAPDPPASPPDPRLLAVTQAINDAIIGADDEQSIIFVNDAAQRMFGWSRDEIVGRPLTTLMPERFHAAHLAGFRRLLAGGEPRIVGKPPVELTARRRDGTEFPIELSLGRYSVDGRVHFAGVVRDISDRVALRAYQATEQAVAQALAESVDEHEAARRVLAAIGSGLGWSLGALWLYDPAEARLRCVEVWQAPEIDGAEFERVSREISLELGEGMPGRAAQERRPVWVGDAPGDPRLPRARFAARAGLRAAVGLPMLSERELVGAVEFYLRRPADTDAGLVGLTERLSAQLGLVFLRRRAERRAADAMEGLRQRAEELERSNQELEQFAYVASHDLSEPLRTITGFLELLRTRHGDRLEGEALEFVDFAVEGAARMRQLIDDLLRYSRAGRAELQLAEVDLEEAVSRAAAGLAAQIEQTGALVRTRSLPVVHADRAQVDQLLQNLIGNALKFRADRPPDVDVTARRRNGDWVVTVQDNGIGVEPAHVARIFEMFQRLHRREDYPGTGIGLAICKRIVERHGGRIWYEPADPGSRFCFTLPAGGAAGPDGRVAR